MSEARLWKYIRDGMGSRWVAQRHEDKYSTGIPDVSYSTDHHGWIELKYLARPPKRPNHPLAIPHFTAEQRNWITRHGSRGGKCFVLLQVEKTYFLLSWDQVGILGPSTYAELKETAFRCWAGGIPWEELLDSINL